MGLGVRSRWSASVAADVLQLFVHATWLSQWRGGGVYVQRAPAAEPAYRRPMRHPDPSPSRRRRAAVRGALAALSAALLALGVALVGSGIPAARAASGGQLTQKISSGRQHVSSLAGAVASASQRVRQLNAGISAQNRQLAALQADLNVKRAQLLSLRAQESVAQSRLQRFQATESGDDRALAQQLIGSYEGDNPDIVSVALESTGFSDLLDRITFVQRIGSHDAQIVGRAKAARRAVASQAIRLGTLSSRRQRLADQALTDRNRVAVVRMRLLSQRLAAARVAAAKSGQLSAAKAQVASLAGQLAKLQAAHSGAAAGQGTSGGGSGAGADSGAGSGAGSGADSGAGAGAGSGSSPPRAPVSRGFEFPMPKSDVLPPDTWSLDDGVDISAPGGTPELAVCSGTIVLHGIGGFGPSAPVLHCDRALAGYAYVYYGHAGPGNWTPIGTHVAQGQVISQVGYGIVGISSGPHLEIGFADSAGSPVGPSSAPAMMSLLRSAYGA
jgi:murein DD-endopeptidase MepM/ murein hydrolase activator NlpD